MSCKRKTRLWDPMAKDVNYMKTATQEMLEEGAKVQRAVRSVERKLVNFQSFNMDDPRYGSADVEDDLELPLVTSYMRHYSQPYPSRLKALAPKTETPDPMFNRLPTNDFEAKTGLAYKFLDDHMHNVSEARRKVNFFRQLRNQSFFQY
ncbi:uncharacterized protein LOC117900660 [Drosophila subobscura]|uniref:uncharacterized protein LOC117900660 n=1 Tax=Drosophila subobscura TaxID=7241 RepID=UPI00155B2C43|nr:uncharacterized protein LOC117900660 [Drosophila subobscura]